MEKQNRIRAYKGDPVNPGVSRKTAGINFAVEIPCGISASLVLYRQGCCAAGGGNSFYRRTPDRQNVRNTDIWIKTR